MTESRNFYKALEFNGIGITHLNGEASNIGTYFADFFITT
jgi:hypothetical protein